MIYVYAPTFEVGLRFSVQNHLTGAVVRDSTDAAEFDRYDEGDEVYVLPGLFPERQRTIRDNYGKSWPRPHIYHTVQEVKANV